MVARVHAALLKLTVVVARFGAKGEKAHKYLLVTGFLSLSDQLPGMVRIFEVLISVIGPGMACDKLFSMVDADPVRIGFECKV